MSDPFALLSLAILLLLGGGTGLLARELVAPRAAPAPIGAAATVLLGLFLLAAALPNVAALGAPRWLALALAQAAGGIGWIVAARRGRLGWPATRPVAIGLLLLLLLQAPLALAATQPLFGNDALLVWWPKVAEVAAGQPPELVQMTPQHQTPFYPRGMAWLASVGIVAPGETIVRLLPVAFAWLAASTMVAAARWCDRERAGVAVAVLFLLLPDVARQCHAGMSDTAIAAALLGAGFGLSLRREHPHGMLLAMAAALGAASIKEEGAVVLLTVAAVCTFDLVRRPWLGRRAAVALLGIAVLVPFARLRAAVPQTRFDTLGILLADPDLLLGRGAAVMECLGRMLVAPASLQAAWEAPSTAQPVSAVLAAVVCLCLLVPGRWPRPVIALPAVAVGLAALATQVASSVDVRWHARTTLPRLSLELLPLLLVAAAARIAPIARAAASR